MRPRLKRIRKSIGACHHTSYSGLHTWELACILLTYVYIKHKYIHHMQYTHGQKKSVVSSLKWNLSIAHNSIHQLTVWSYCFLLSHFYYDICSYWSQLVIWGEKEPNENSQRSHNLCIYNFLSTHQWHTSQNAQTSLFPPFPFFWSLYPLTHASISVLKLSLLLHINKIFLLNL